MNIKLLPPNINKAVGEFSSIRLDDGSEAILYGLGAIKSVGMPAVNNLIKVRPENGFSSVDEFMSKIDPAKINKRTMESLIKVGAFDEYGFTRKCLVENLPKLCENSRKIAESKREAEISLFDVDDITSGIKADLSIIEEEYPLKEKLEYEKEILGIYLSAHPLDEFSEQINKLDYYKSLDFDNLKGSGQIFCVGKIEDFKALMSKSGKRYAKMQLMDFYSSFEVVVFERNVEELEEIFKDEFKKTQAYAFRLGFKREDRDFSLMMNEVLELDEAKESGIKAKVGFRNKTNIDKEQFTQEPKEFENSVIELDLNKLSKDLVYEIHEIARNSHNLKDKEGKRLVIKVSCVDSCLLYHTDFIINEQIKEQIKRKCAS